MLAKEIEELEDILQMAKCLTKRNNNKATILGNLNHAGGLFSRIYPFLVVHSENFQWIQVFPFYDEAWKIAK